MSDDGHVPLSSIQVRRPGEYTAEWNAWIESLKTGDEVLVCNWISKCAIYRAAVRVTPTGRIHIADRRDRADWRSPCVHVPGGGDRFISPVPQDLGGKS